MAAGAAALYVTKYAALDSLYGFSGLEVQLIPRTLGLAGTLEFAELSPADKTVLQAGFLSSLISLFEVLGFRGEWLSSMYCSVY